MSLRHALLGLLSHGPASGYDLLKQFELSLANVWSATQSQVYTELGRLTDNGHLEVSDEGSRGRKEYRLTDSGRTELHHWLTQTRPKTVRRSETLLRVFFLDQVSRQEAVEYLKGIEADSETELSQLEELERSVPWDSSPLSIYGRIALEYGIRASSSQRDWAEWAARQVRDHT
ncbi:MAG TPA: PadR family transcriptional regulator [Stackebrandtia sp.]|uniref:PadR family transcriptional regulator n=1 Tax=Stackebrandtia sp. TaxID=2023065 RepID=UPI002D420E87|nr:PadR family transcriptional regulator [Stackebrandtia sp.]HZE37990.1 PadR family transcriptional regulator [Stackebrandtia sp.]